MRCPHCESELSEALIMSAAARIAVGRRKVHRGAAPKIFACRWCRAEIRGRTALEQHEKSCEKHPAGEVTDADLAALSWTPPDAA
jgi:hypothetical protein